MEGKNAKKLQKQQDIYAAIVTGASSGIGLAIAETLCEIGYSVYGFGRNFAREEAKALQQNYENFHPIVCNLLDTVPLCDEVNAIRKREAIRILVNAAGVGYYGLHEELSVKQIQTLIRTNLEVPMILTNRLLRTLKENHGYIINVSSITAKKTNPEKTVSVYDTKFQKKWMDSCDEAEKIMIGKCAFKAYSATNTVCYALAIVLAVCALVFETGFLPSLVVCLIWIVNQSVYCKEALRYSKAGNKIS